MKHGISVRLYAFALNAQEELLVSESGLPKQVFSAGKDFQQNVSELIRNQCGLNAGSSQPAGLVREFGQDGCMAIAFWVHLDAGHPSTGWTFQSLNAAKHHLPEFEGELLEKCLRSRPAVAVQ